MSFQNEKNQFLKKPDKSSIQGIDKAILPLVNKINKKPDYYTTSSCSGRIVLMPETGKKRENVFLFVKHGPIKIKELKNALKKIKSKNIIYLKLEPCIMHVACKDLDSALRMVNIARQSGWKKSGIISRRNIIEMLSTEILSSPVADKGKITVSDDYLDILVKECNKKLKQTRQKILNLEKQL